MSPSFPRETSLASPEWRPALGARLPIVDAVGTKQRAQPSNLLLERVNSCALSRPLLRLDAEMLSYERREQLAVRLGRAQILPLELTLGHPRAPRVVHATKGRQIDAVRGEVTHRDQPNRSSI